MASDSFKPLEARSLKAQCVETLERLILSGELAVGESIPPERDLAKRLGVSRPVVHEALVELAAKGFVIVEPRRGIKVADYYRNGTLAIFESIVLHSDGLFPRNVLEDLVAFRRLIEIEAVKLAAACGGGEYFAALEAVLAGEEALPRPQASPSFEEVKARSDLDVRFHLLLAEASGNRILPLVVNSIAPIYRKLVERFYSTKPEIGAVLDFHRNLLEAMKAQKVDESVAIIDAMLKQGANSIGALNKQ